MKNKIKISGDYGCHKPVINPSNHFRPASPSMYLTSLPVHDWSRSPGSVDILLKLAKNGRESDEREKKIPNANIAYRLDNSKQLH